MKTPTFDAPSYGPDVLKAIAQAFDEAWQNIAGNFGGDAGAIEAARLKLANALLSVASEGSRDPEVLKIAALQVMAGEYRGAPVLTGTPARRS
jgi:hypothetical protein